MRGKRRGCTMLEGLGRARSKCADGVVDQAYLTKSNNHNRKATVHEQTTSCNGDQDVKRCEMRGRWIGKLFEGKEAISAPLTCSFLLKL